MHGYILHMQPYFYKYSELVHAHLACLLYMTFHPALLAVANSMHASMKPCIFSLISFGEILHNNLSYLHVQVHMIHRE